MTLEELRKKWASIRGRWPMLIAALLWIVNGATNNWVIDTALPWIWERVSSLSIAPIGPFGLVTFALIVWHLVDGHPAIQRRRSERRTKTKGTDDLKQLRETLARTEETKALAEQSSIDMVRAMRYGAGMLGPGLPPLDSLQSGFLLEHMKELRNPTVSAGLALHRVLSSILRRMWEAQPRTEAYYLAFFVNEQFLEYGKRSLERFQEDVDANRDTREAFARYYAWHALNREWLLRLSKLQGISLDEVDGYGVLEETNRQLDLALRQKLDAPQFETIRRWLRDGPPTLGV